MRKIDYFKIQETKWLCQRYHGTPCFAVIPHEGYNNTIGVGSIIASFKEEGAENYLPISMISDHANKVFYNAANKSDYVKNTINKWKLVYSAYIRFLLDLTKQDFNKLNDENLIKITDIIIKKYLRVWELSAFIDVFDIWAEPDFLKKINFLIRTNERQLSKDELKILLAPLDLMYMHKEKISLYRIVKKLFEGINPDSHPIKKLISDHKRKYFFLENNYAQVKVLDEAYFIRKIKEKLKNNKNEYSEVNKLLADLSARRKEFKKIIKIKKLNKNMVGVLKYFSFLSVQRDQRKYATQLTNHFFYLILNILADRHGVKKENLLVISPREFRFFLDDKKKPNILLDARSKGCFYIYDFEGKFFFAVSKQYRQLKKFFNEMLQMNEGVIKGQCANKGKITGSVKVLMKVSEFHKMEKGDILVTGMTRPEFVPILNLASAIITDEGGITCHAAIVSRELNIPCVIGTQNATKILKDNDLVEIDADNGVVKVLKK